MASPFRNPMVRWATSVTSGAILAGFAYLYLEGPVQLAVYAFAVLDTVFLAWVLDQAG